MGRWFCLGSIPDQVCIIKYWFFVNGENHSRNVFQENCSLVDDRFNNNELDNIIIQLSTLSTDLIIVLKQINISYNCFYDVIVAETVSWYVGEIKNQNTNFHSKQQS